MIGRKQCCSAPIVYVCWEMNKQALFSSTKLKHTWKKNLYIKSHSKSLLKTSDKIEESYSNFFYRRIEYLGLE